MFISARILTCLPRIHHWIYLVLTLLYPPFIRGETQKTTGVIDLNYYRDSRTYNTFTTNLLAEVRNAYEYFSLLDIYSDSSTGETTDSNFYYTEQNLRFPLGPDSPLAASSQAVFQSGNRNDILRVGLLMNMGKFSKFREFFKKYNMSFGLNFFPIQLDYQDEKSWQLEYFYKLLIFPKTFEKKFYLSGFADQNIKNGSMVWVTEHQLGYEVGNSFFLVSEFRVNQYSPRQKGLAFGLEYLIAF